MPYTKDSLKSAALRIAAYINHEFENMTGQKLDPRNVDNTTELGVLVSTASILALADKDGVNLCFLSSLFLIEAQLSGEAMRPAIPVEEVVRHLVYHLLTSPGWDSHRAAAWMLETVDTAFEIDFTEECVVDDTTKFH